MLEELQCGAIPMLHSPNGADERRNGRNFAGLFGRTEKGLLGRCEASCLDVVPHALNHYNRYRIDCSEFQIPTFETGAWTLSRGAGGRTRDPIVNVSCAGLPPDTPPVILVSRVPSMLENDP